MTITRSVDQEKQLTTFTATGEITFNELMAFARPFFEKYPTKYEMWDFRNATLEPLSSDELQKVVQFVKQHAEKRRGGKAAWVVSKTIDFGLGRMTQTFAEIERFPIDIKVTYSIDEATKWLDEDV